MVFCGLVIACRLATWPTSRSPLFVNATTEGVVRPPSALGITCGSPPSITATHEFVVPRSMPIIFPILPPCSRAEGTVPLRQVCSNVAAHRAPRLLLLARDLDRDLAGLGLFGLRDRDFQDTVAIRRFDLVGLDRVAQRERALERPIGTLDPVIHPVLLLLGPGLLAADHELVVLEGNLDVLELHA